MARELKVFAFTLCARSDEVARLGQASHVRQVRAIVATTTKAEAIRLFGITASEARDFMSGPTGNAREIEVAMKKPGQVFAFALNDWDKKDPIEIERKPHVPIPRRKRPTFEEIQAAQAAREKRWEDELARQFSTEELQYMVEMFSVSNNPVALSIAEKARLTMIADEEE